MTNMAKLHDEHFIVFGFSLSLSLNPSCFAMLILMLYACMYAGGHCFLLQTVFDHDTFTRDDKMGDAEFDIKAYIDALRMNLQDLPNGTVITRVQPSRQNCLAEESCIMWNEGKVVQDLCLRLRNVECGELEIQLQWIDLPGSKGL